MLTEQEIRNILARLIKARRAYERDDAFGKRNIIEDLGVMILTLFVVLGK